MRLVRLRGKTVGSLVLAFRSVTDTNFDVLADVLRAVRLEGTAYFQADFAAPWAMSFSGSGFANFHLVTEGTCWLTSDDRRTSGRAC